MLKWIGVLVVLAGCDAPPLPVKRIEAVSLYDIRVNNRTGGEASILRCERVEVEGTPLLICDGREDFIIARLDTTVAKAPTKGKKP
jgi:hypothetical protein